MRFLLLAAAAASAAPLQTRSWKGIDPGAITLTHRQHIASGTPFEDISFAGWSPSGRYLLVTEHVAGEALWVPHVLWILETGTGRVRRLSRGPVRGESWSPDERHLAVVGRDGEVVVLSAGPRGFVDGPAPTARTVSQIPHVTPSCLVDWGRRSRALYVTTGSEDAIAVPLPPGYPPEMTSATTPAVGLWNDEIMFEDGDQHRIVATCAGPAGAMLLHGEIVLYTGKNPDPAGTRKFQVGSDGTGRVWLGSGPAGLTKARARMPGIACSPDGAMAVRHELRQGQDEGVDPPEPEREATEGSLEFETLCTSPPETTRLGLPRALRVIRDLAWSPDGNRLAALCLPAGDIWILTLGADQ